MKIYKSTQSQNQDTYKSNDGPVVNCWTFNPVSVGSIIAGAEYILRCHCGVLNLYYLVIWIIPKS